MKKLLFGTMLLALVMGVPNPTMARVDVNISIGLPPPIVFAAPPEVIVIPETYVYVVPDIEADLFFWNGWWWRLWEGRWYRSHYYNRGWRYYNNVPSFYFDIDPGWRGYYRDRNWYGHRWNYERIPNQRLQQNWKRWQDNRRWERRGTWGVQSYQPRLQPPRQELRQQRQQHYRQRPDVLEHQQQRHPQVQEPRQQLRERGPRPRQQLREGGQEPRQQLRERGQEPQRSHSHPQGKPEGREGEHRR